MYHQAHEHPKTTSGRQYIVRPTSRIVHDILRKRRVAELTTIATYPRNKEARNFYNQSRAMPLDLEVLEGNTLTMAS
jgi:hypothetical protein